MLIDDAVRRILTKNMNLGLFGSLIGSSMKEKRTSQ